MDSLTRSTPSLRDVCGTDRGYQRHLYNKELSCEPCALAHRDYCRSYAEKNRESLREKKKLYANAHPEVFKEYKRKWKALNPEKVEADKRNRRGLLRGVPSEPYTAKDIISLYGSLCYLCGDEIDLTAPRAAQYEGWEMGLQLDHVIPLKLGGTNLISNIRPTHGKCNNTKHVLLPDIYPKGWEAK